MEPLAFLDSPPGVARCASWTAFGTDTKRKGIKSAALQGRKLIGYFLGALFALKGYLEVCRESSNQDRELTSVLLGDPLYRFAFHHQLKSFAPSASRVTLLFPTLRLKVARDFRA
jgi:hypothetical protein